jgi:endonuclease I
MYSNKREMTFGTDQAGNYKQEGDVYNREHSFPNSWFGGKVMPMYTDLNHLYPTDGYVNNKRSNFPFGETNGESYKSANGFSKLGKCTWPGYTGTVFEPNDEYKGDFARTYFYMVTCYEEKLPDWYANCPDCRFTLDGTTYPGLVSWQLEMLMKWANDDPVSEKETQRNMAVYSIQKNRNPFIDYPGLERYIWGNLQEVPFSYTGASSVASATSVDGSELSAIYAPDGSRLGQMRRGVNILRTRSGRVVKKMVK